MARRKSLAGSNTSRARIPLPVQVHGVDDAWMVSRRLCLSAPSMCRRRHVYVRACAMHCTCTMRRRRHVVHAWSRHTRAPYVRVNCIPKRNGHLYASSESTPLLQDSLPRFPLGNYIAWTHFPLTWGVSLYIAWTHFPLTWGVFRHR